MKHKKHKPEKSKYEFDNDGYPIFPDDVKVGKVLEDKDDYDIDDIEEDAGHISTDFTTKLRDKGDWLALSSPLLKFFGESANTAIFLVGITSLYHYWASKGKISIENQIVYRPYKFKHRWGVTPWYQKKAIEVMQKYFGLMEKVGMTHADKTVLKLDFKRINTLAKLVFDIKDKAKLPLLLQKLQKLERNGKKAKLEKRLNYIKKGLSGGVEYSRFKKTLLNYLNTIIKI